MVSVITTTLTGHWFDSNIKSVIKILIGAMAMTNTTAALIFFFHFWHN